MNSLIPIGIAGIITVGLTQFIAKKFKSSLRNQAKKINLRSRSTIIYLIVVVLLLALPALSFMSSIGCQILFPIIFLYSLILGAIHCVTHYKYVDWAEKSVDILPDILFTIAIMLFSTVAFTLLLKYGAFRSLGVMERSTTPYIHLLTPFVLGMIIMKVIMLSEMVENFDFDYPLFKISEGKQKVSRLQREESVEIKVELMIPNENNDSEFESHKCILLSDLKFGVNIYEYIELNNQGNSKKIITSYGNDEYKYLFYFRPKRMWLGTKRVIDPHVSLIKNKIGDMDVIYFQKHI